MSLMTGMGGKQALRDWRVIRPRANFDRYSLGREGCVSEELFTRLFGNAVGGLLLLAIGYAIARGIQRRRKSEVLPKSPIVVAAIVALIAFGTAANRSLVSARDAEKTDAMVVRQPANGLTDAAITAEYAEEIKSYLLTNLRANAPADTGEITAGTAGVMIVDGRRIAVHHFAVNGDESIVLITGVGDGELVRVTCFVGSGNVDYRSPECASTVRKSLGLKLP